MAWTKSNLGNGWVKLTESSAALAAGTTAGVTSTAISGDDLNDMAKAGSYMLQVAIANTGTVVADTSIHGVQDDESTYQSIATDIIADQNQAETKLYKVSSGVASPGIKFNTTKDSGSGTAIVTWTVMYWDGGPNMSDLTIGGVGSDPS
tara:strand:+ start:9856 stop:10302 length:447 start_codon:yes stop_codon:yes gene_type:complete